ncbi:RHS repeat protein [Streptomyces sp. BH-SS-21]|uniref:RHS repeat protein n=1 Tax=Streptomyces liliiviolaceus TaxID=2823109 RepID=A0A940Y0Z9_9ACTN|nr:RHS repeat-associated core domain-containing protein [Streptomyces liliiviolaceus]MBQ0848679.1 RHS repeat protein [Streptomyces liliiviolaceus]
MAGYRPTDWHVLDLEKDPTPGDPVRVKSLAKSLHDFADDVQDALRLVNGMAGEDAVLTMVGKTAEVFRDEFSGVPKNLKKLKKSYDLAGDALAAYWPELERAQTLADKALAKGREAQADLSSAKSKLSSADSWVTRANKEADKYKDDPGSAGKDVEKPDEAKVRAATRDAQSAKDAHTAAQSDVTSAQSALDAAKKMAADARQMREDAAGEAKRKLDDASDAGIPNRKWYEEVGDWFVDNWDTIVAVCKVVVAVLGIIALIIGGPILGAIVLIAALVVLADTLNKYMKGQASLWDVAFAALDCIPGMKGLTTLGGLAKGLKGLRTMNGLKAGLKGMAAGVRGLGKSARGALADGAKGAYNRLKSKIKGCGDPVDAATGEMFLTDTDIVLPGVLPSAFTRRVASGYRTGWWFGPTWSSTIDQRLEVDENGIVFVTEDGMLLSYPHPETSHAPVLPEAGPRWPLVRLDAGGYRIDDPISGRTHHFAAVRERLCLLERVSDRNGNTIEFAYTADGAPSSIRHSGGYRITFTVEEGRVTALGLAGAAEDGSDLTIKRYGYTGGDLTSVTNSSGLPMRFTYDERLRITSWTDTNDSTYEYTYDDRDRCVTQGGEAGHVTNSFSYDGTDSAWPGCRITTVTSPEGAVTRFVVNDNCQVVAEVNPLGGTTRTGYDDHHHLVSMSDELGSTTRLVNNALGQATEVIYPDGAVIRYGFNDLNLPAYMALPDGTGWTQSYDEAGNCTAVTDPAGVTTRYAYTGRGHLSAITDALGHSTTVRCDPAGLPLENINPLGAATTWERDAFGRPVARVDPLGRATLFSWTVEGLPARRAAPDGTVESWTYDGEGNCTSHTDQMGRVSRFEYTHFDLLTARTDPDGARHEFGYDSSLRLTSVVNPAGLSWGYTYDAVGNLISETDFDDRTLAYTVDAAGRYTARTNALGQTVRYERDALGRVVRKDVEGRITTYAYGAADQLSEVNGPDAALTRQYDRAGRLIAETVNGRTMSHAYDELGRRIRRTTPSGAVSTWEFDAADNRIRLIASGRPIAFTHDASGHELSRQVGESASMSATFDELGRITTQSISTAVAPEIQHRAYSYRPDGNLVGLDDKLNGRRSYELDAAGRVTAVHARDWSERYAYDEAGNQSAAAWPASHPGQESVGPRHYSGTRIEQAGRTRYEHDALGRVTLRQRTRLSRKPDTWHYEWDAEDQLAAVVTPDGTRWRYHYDPLGRRTDKQRLAPDGETVVERIEFTWDDSALCEQTTVAPDLRDPVTVTWDYDGLHPISQTERMIAADAPQREVDSRFFAIVTDLIGTPTELIDESGAIAWRARATLWGATAWASSSTAYTPLRFPGQYYDAETGLHYNYFRHYDPETARYLSSDLLGLTPAPNPTTYVHNPLTWADPLGLAPKCPKGKGKGEEGEGRQRKTSQEEHHYFDSFSEARANAKQRAQLGDDQIPFVQELGPHRGRVTGMQSPDGSRGWRIDFDPKDPEKGFHVNWWSREGRKRSDDWKLGANTVRGGTEGDYLAILEHFPHT